MYNRWMDSLAQVKLFDNIDIDELNKMLMCLKPTVVSFKKKEYIAIVENEFKGIGIIISGEIIVTKENVSGDRIIMSKLGKANMFGEIIAFSNNDKWPTTVIAETDCTVLFLPPNKITGNCPNMCLGHRFLISNMLKIVSQKALELNKKVDYLTIKSIRAKISTFLLEQYKNTGKLTFMISLKRNELAQFLNMSRPSLSRELIKMKEEGIIDFYKSSFKIVDIEKLKLCLK